MNYPALVLVSALTCLTVGPLQADEVLAASESTAKEKTPLTPAQIDELLAPIALYPDPLIAIILPAATFPTDVVMAARFLKDGGSPSSIESQDWDDSVKALARYPDVLKWMDDNLAWTKQLGSVFVLQPAAVLGGTQRLRTAAIAAGNLKTTPQQTVVVEREVVRIVPAQREVIYVPVYDPVYVYRPCTAGVYYPGSVISFSSGYPAGFWLSYDFNWGLNTVVVIGRPYRTVVWNRYPTWCYPTQAVVYHHVWRPSPVCVQTARRELDRRPDYLVSRPTSYSHYQVTQKRDTSPQNYARPENRAPQEKKQVKTSPIQRTASAPVISTTSQSIDRINSNKLRLTRAPVVEAEQITQKTSLPSRSDRRDSRAAFQTTPNTTSPSLVERTFDTGRKQPFSTATQVTASNPQPKATTRTDRSDPSSLRDRPALQQVSARTTERTISPALTSSSTSNDTADQSPSRGRYWRQP